MRALRSFGGGGREKGGVYAKVSGGPGSGLPVPIQFGGFLITTGMPRPSYGILQKGWGRPLASFPRRRSL